MPSQLDNMTSRKRKSSSEVRASRKVGFETTVSASEKKNRKSQKMHLSPEDSSALRTSRSTDKLSRICCECQEVADRRRCLGSPELQGQEGKENELRSEQEVSSCKANSVLEEQAPECVEPENSSRVLFPDDDSNQILPVEQFFGNLDIVQDFPRRSPATSPSARRKERFRHYYAQEDSDGEEVSHGGLRRDDGAGT
uniref:Chromosome 1 C1orf174 homolog n=1 Tax=Xiphophorus maculatus TaxID=8083 RepID=M3ZSI4_XIPMA